MNLIFDNIIFISIYTIQLVRFLNTTESVTNTILLLFSTLFYATLWEITCDMFIPQSYHIIVAAILWGMTIDIAYLRLRGILLLVPDDQGQIFVQNIHGTHLPANVIL